MDPIALATTLEKAGLWGVVALLVVALICLWKAREKDNREHYETAIKWAEQGVERETELRKSIDTLAKAFGVKNDGQ